MRNLVQRSRIIHAIDVIDREKAIQICTAVRRYVDAIKVSYPLVLKNGLEVIQEVKDASGLPILACFKIADIPEMSGDILNITLDAGADGVTFHGFVGRDSLKKCVQIANQRDAYIFVVAEMSHPGAEEFTQPVGERIAVMAKELGAHGIVVPATRPQRIRRYREIVGEDMLILSPGVGAQGGQPGDTILQGANFEIVGRLIYENPDPARKARMLNLQIEERIKERPIIDTYVRP